MSDKEKYYIWTPTISDVLEAMEMAKKNGKKPGDSFEEEFLKVMKKKKQKPVGTTDKDVDQLTGDLREKGLKITNIKEIDRRGNKDA